MMTEYSITDLYNNYDNIESYIDIFDNIVYHSKFTPIEIYNNLNETFEQKFHCDILDPIITNNCCEIIQKMFDHNIIIEGNYWTLFVDGTDEMIDLFIKNKQNILSENETNNVLTVLINKKMNDRCCHLLKKFSYDKDFNLLVLKKSIILANEYVLNLVLENIQDMDNFDNVCLESLSIFLNKKSNFNQNIINCLELNGFNIHLYKNKLFSVALSSGNILALKYLNKLGIDFDDILDKIE